MKKAAAGRPLLHAYSLIKNCLQWVKLSFLILLLFAIVAAKLIFAVIPRRG